MNCNEKGFIPVWWWHQLLSRSILYAACLEFHIGCRLGRELFTLLICSYRCPCSHGLRSKRLYHSVVVTPAPVRLSLVSHRLLARTFHLALVYLYWNYYLKLLQLCTTSEKLEGYKPDFYSELWIFFPVTKSRPQELSPGFHTSFHIKPTNHQQYLHFSKSDDKGVKPACHMVADCQVYRD